jgi:high-affinity iron transporter
MIAAFYKIGVDDYSNTECYWEGSFAIFASLVISILGAALLRVSKMKEKWAVKLSKALDSRIEKSRGKRGAFKLWVEKYIMFTLPLVTVLREGLEAIVFIAGVTFSSPASAVPLPVIVGVIAGGIIGYILYKSVQVIHLISCHSNGQQGRGFCQTAILSHRLDVPFIPCCCRSLLKGCVVPASAGME